MFPKNILGVLFVSTFVFASSAYAGKIELTTYYPAPYGEYSKLQAKGSCVGTGCVAGDVTNDNLLVKGTTTTTNATISGTTTTADAIVSGTTSTTNLTVTGTTTVSSAGGFVIQKRTDAPVNPAEGQIWIQS